MRRHNRLLEDSHDRSSLLRAPQGADRDRRAHDGSCHRCEHRRALRPQSVSAVEPRRSERRSRRRCATRAESTRSRRGEVQRCVPELPAASPGAAFVRRRCRRRAVVGQLGRPWRGATARGHARHGLLPLHLARSTDSRTRVHAARRGSVAGAGHHLELRALGLVARIGSLDHRQNAHRQRSAAHSDRRLAARLRSTNAHRHLAAVRHPGESAHGGHGCATAHHLRAPR